MQCIHLVIMSLRLVSRRQYCDTNLPPTECNVSFMFFDCYLLGKKYQIEPFLLIPGCHFVWQRADPKQMADVCGGDGSTGFGNCEMGTEEVKWAATSRPDIHFTSLKCETHGSLHIAGPRMDSSISRSITCTI